MSVQRKAERLFEFISQVYSIDLPVNRDITKYGMELFPFRLWQRRSAWMWRKGTGATFILTQSREGRQVVPQDFWEPRLHAIFRVVIYESILFHLENFEGRPIVASCPARGV
jgi:hypothetical protein